MQRVKFALAALVCVACGWFASAVHDAKAEAQPQPWLDMGDTNGVSAYRFSDNGRFCYVTTPAGGISCVR